jgi:glycine/serine hydroxymethyltransferase
MHVMAWKVICFFEALKLEFKQYQGQIMKKDIILS